MPGLFANVWCLPLQMSAVSHCKWQLFAIANVCCLPLQMAAISIAKLIIFLGRFS